MKLIPLATPFPCLDLDQLEINIRDMAEKAEEMGVALRPMIKTHKSKEIALKQVELGASGVTVATLDEAKSVIEAGIKDVFIAYEIIGPYRIEQLLKLNQNANIKVGIDSLAAARHLNKVISSKSDNIMIDYLLEIDTGLHRCGISPGIEAVNLVEKIEKNFSNLNLKGIFTHAGHVYGAELQSDIEKIGSQEGKLMEKTVSLFKQKGKKLDIVSVGSTPTVKYSGQNSEVNEIRPGNYVFYDNIQLGLGSASLDMISLTIVSTVISRPNSNQAIIDAGSKSLNLDKGAHGADLVTGHGLVKYEGKTRPDIIINNLSEEHGFLEFKSPQGPLPEVGDRIEIIPNHSCAVVNLYDNLVGVKNGDFKRLITVDARRKIKLI